MFFVQMSGFPGSGKSTLAREIANRTGAVVVDHDIVKSALLENIDETPIDLILAGKVSYGIDWSLVEFHLSQGSSVVFDAPCFYEEMVQKGTKLAEKYNAAYKYVECYLDDLGEINNRLHKRETMISQFESFHSEEEFASTLENSKKPSNYECLLVKTDQQPEHYIQDVMNYINAEN